jgi:hypothetical protein
VSCFKQAPFCARVFYMQPTASKALSKVGIVRHTGRSGAWRGGGAATAPPPPPPVATSPRPRPCSHCRRWDYGWQTAAFDAAARVLDKRRRIAVGDDALLSVESSFQSANARVRTMPRSTRCSNRSLFCALDRLTRKRLRRR